MQVIYDLQQELETLDLSASECIVPIGDLPPTLSVEVVGDVKTILVKNRKNRVAGLGVTLTAIPKLHFNLHAYPHGS